MRKLVYLAAVVAALIVTAPATAALRPISITATGFVPRDVTITVGDTVVWTNTDTRVHRVVVARTTCSMTIQPGATGSCTFGNAGRFNYEEPTMRGGAWRGTVIVRAGPISVTITARPSIVRYRNATTLSGTVSNRQANERVAVRAQQCGATTMSTVATVATTDGGAWTLVVRPLKNTVYQANWRTASANFTVRVRPRVTLRKLTRGRFAVRVSAAESFAGKVVVFQRYNATRRRWIRVRLVTLRAMGGTTPTLISGANFRARVRVGTRVRAVITQAQVGTCYLGGTSNIVRR